MTRETWATRFGFIMATVGFSVGLGNIWRFPYLTGANGGGAFLLIYLVLAVLIGIPLFTAEITLGRKSRLTPIAGMRALTGRRSVWNLIGWLGVLAAFLIFSFYQLILGWTAAYLVKAVTGGFAGASLAETEAAFSDFVSRPWAVLAYTAAMLALLGTVVARGLRGGVEVVARWLMPALFLFLVVLAVGSLTFDGAGRGLAWYLKPDFSQVTGGVVLTALGQVFFSIGVGMAAAFAYGSYLDPEGTDIPGSAATIVGFDTLAAFLAGLVMFPALFAFGFAPDVGPGLLFVTMSSLFSQVPSGTLVGSIFFFLIVIAGFTSGLALLEALTATAMDSMGWSRRRAVSIVLVAAFVAGIPSALSFGPWADARAWGLDIFGLVDFISGSVLLTLGGLLIALYTAYVWTFEGFRADANRGARLVRVGRAWGPFVRFVIPVALVLVMLGSLGLL